MRQVDEPKMLVVDDKNRLLLWGVPVAIRPKRSALDSARAPMDTESYLAFVSFGDSGTTHAVSERHKWHDGKLSMTGVRLLYLAFRDRYPNRYPSRVYVGWYAYKQLMGWYRKLGGDKDERPHKFLQRGLKPAKSVGRRKEEARRRDESRAAFNNDWRAKKVGRVSLPVHGQEQVQEAAETGGSGAEHSLDFRAPGDGEPD